MSHRKIAAILLSILAVIPAAYAKDQAPFTITGAPQVEGTRAMPKPSTPPKRETAPDPDADARRCLEFPTNLQVHVCAEKYRPHNRIP